MNIINERSQSGEVVYGMILTIGHSGKGKTWRLQKDQWAPEVGEGEMSRMSTEGFQDSAMTLHDTVMVDTCRYTFA